VFGELRAHSGAKRTTPAPPAAPVRKLPSAHSSIRLVLLFAIGCASVNAATPVSRYFGFETGARAAGFRLPRFLYSIISSA